MDLVDLDGLGGPAGIGRTVLEERPGIYIAPHPAIPPSFDHTNITHSSCVDH